MAPTRATRDRDRLRAAASNVGGIATASGGARDDDLSVAAMLAELAERPFEEISAASACLQIARRPARRDRKSAQVDVGV